MACKDTSVAKERILNKQKEFENIKRDIYSILEFMTENVTRAAQSILDKSVTNNRRQFRSSYANADQIIETSLLKLMEARAKLQNESDDETCSDYNEDEDCQSSISSDFINPRSVNSVFSNVDSELQHALIIAKFAQNCKTLSSELKSASPTSVSSKLQPHTISPVPTQVVSIQCQVDCLNTEKNKEILNNFDSLLPYQEPTKQAASPNNFWNSQKCAISPEQCKSALAQQSSVAEKQQLNFLEQCNSSNVTDSNQPPLFDTVSEESEATITNSKPNGEDALSSVEAGFEMKSGNPLFSNHASKHTEGLIHQFKDFNLDELVNTLAHLTEPKDSGGNPETECFQKHVQNIYKYVAPNVSGAIGKFNPNSLGQSLGTSAPLVPSFDQFSPVMTLNHASNSPDFDAAIPALPSNSVFNKGYNFEIFVTNSAMTLSNFSDSIMPHADQTTQDNQNAKESVFDISGGHNISRSLPAVKDDTLVAQEIPSHSKVAPGFSPIFTPSDSVPQDSGRIATIFNEHDVSPHPVDSECSGAEVPFSLPQLQYDDGSVIIATVEHINSPSSFYIRPKNNDVSLETLTAQLSKCYDGSYLELFTDKATLGFVCCALSYNDNSWYRAVITNIHKPLSPGYIDGTVTVRLVDKGITETLPIFRLRRLNEAFFAVPCLVVHCTLHDANPPMNQTEWAEEQIDMFTNLACRNDIKAKVHEKLVTGEFDVDLITLEKSESETVEVSILDCFFNAACCSSNISNASDDIVRTSPVQLVASDEDKKSKISFVIKNKNKPLLDTFQKKKTRVNKSMRQYKTTREANDASGSDSDKPISAPNFKPPMCWEDLDSQSSNSSVEKEAETILSNKMNTKNPSTSLPFPTLCNIGLNLSNYAFQDAMLAHVVSPSEFYIHPVVEEATYIDELNNDLNRTYAKVQAPLAIVDKQSIPKGSFWCAKFPENGMWYRAKVLDVIEIEDPSEKLSHESKKKKKKLKTKPTLLESKFKVHVFYVDHGDSAWIESNDLHQLKKKFYKHPALAVRCSLMSVYPKCDPDVKKDESTPAWPPEAGKALELWAGEKTIRIQVFSAEEYQKTGEYQVLLWGLENEGCLFNEEIVKCGLADSNIYCKDKKEDSQTVENHNNDECAKLSLWDPMTSDFQDLRNSYAVDVEDPGVALTGYKARDESDICIFYQRGQLCKRGSNCRYKHIQPPLDGQTTDLKAVAYSNDSVSLPNIGSWVIVDVTAILNAAHFYVNFPHSPKPLSKLKEEVECEATTKEFENLTTLQTKLQNAYKDKFPRDGDYLLKAEGEIVVARFSHDNEWYRARVTRVDPEKCRVKVFYVDYGNCEWVSEVNVRDIRPEFMHFPFQAVECRLANIECIAGDDEELKKEARTFFRKQVENRKLVAQIKDIIGDTLYLDLFYTENETDFHINRALVTMEYAKNSNSGTKSRLASTSKKISMMPG